ncbi:signal peptidase II [Saccharomonospora sp. CUA-673]|nr:signal peptidase II [Saccharomonospora sp. CUA-673]
MRLGLAAVPAGAVANLIDRGVDGAVTDYLHTGWFPTFNLADVFITGGGALLVLASLRTTSPSPDRSESGAS